jgi:hypothetical protein
MLPLGSSRGISQTQWPRLLKEIPSWIAACSLFEYFVLAEVFR